MDYIWLFLEKCKFSSEFDKLWFADKIIDLVKLKYNHIVIKEIESMNYSLHIKKINQLSGHKGAIYALEKGKNPRTIISAGGDGNIIKWRLDQPDYATVLASCPSSIFSIAYLPQKQWLLAGNIDGGLHWINLNDKSNNKNIAHHNKGIFNINLLNDKIITLGGKGNLTTWDIGKQRTIETLKLSHNSLRGWAFNNKQKEIAISASDNSIQILDMDSLDVKMRLPNAHSSSVFCVQYAPDSSYLVSGGRDAKVKIWDVANNYQLARELAAHMYTINQIKFQPNGDLFATASRDKTIKIWDASNFKLLKVIDFIKNKGHLNSVNALLWLSNSEFISAGDDKMINHWELSKKFHTS